MCVLTAILSELAGWLDGWFGVCVVWGLSALGYENHLALRRPGSEAWHAVGDNWDRGKEQQCESLNAPTDVCASE